MANFIFEIEFIDGNNDLCICHSLGESNNGPVKAEKEAKKHIKEQCVVKKWISCNLYQ